MLQAVRGGKVDEKNVVICLVSMIPSWVMVLNCLKMCMSVNFVLTSARNISLLKQFTYIWKVLLSILRKWYCLLCYDLLFRRLQKSKNFSKFRLSQHLFWYFNCYYLMNHGSDTHEPYHFLKECNETFQMNICKLL